MRTKACAVIFTLLLAAAAVPAEKQPYPNRWVRINSSLREDSDVEKVRRIVQTAAEHGLNGVALSAGLDSLDLKTSDYFRRLQQVRELCEKAGMEIIPTFMSAGYGGAVLAHDRNLAAGLRVRDALFVVSGGKARVVADPEVALVNGGFEEVRDGEVAGFRRSGPAGGSVAADAAVFKAGKASLRFTGFESSPREFLRVAQDLRVRPNRCYRLSCWTRSEGMGSANPFGSGNFQLEVLGGDEKRPLQYQNPRVSSGGEWARAVVAFNSLGYDRVEIAAKVRGAAGGKFWLDELQVEEIGLVNLLRRPGTPLAVRSDSSGTVYSEGIDFAPVSDPQLGSRFDHDGPVIEVLPAGHIQEGERLRVSYYHSASIYNGQTPICMSEPKLYEIWRTQARLVHQALAPRKYLLNMDEVRVGGSCEACKKRGMSLGEILGDCITRQYTILREAAKAEIYVWSDMLDPNHNANPDRKYYYLAEGNYAGSWHHVPKDLGIVCWYYEKRVPSLHHFSSLGFKTVAGAYYDGDTLDNPKGWLEALAATPSASGMMYTTWLDKYDLLAGFGDLLLHK
jgi:hypothetical protein